jgi:Outer membrane lipoprotein carrier protein LolA-like
VLAAAIVTLNALLPTIAARGATPDVDALIAALARPAPSVVAFTEVRFSPLLRNALVVSGELGYSGPANLDRRVRQPYREDTSIRGESVRVEREGEPPRSFALRRAPELRGLLDGFSALLAGDAESIKLRFDVVVAGDENNWRLELTPRDAGARRRLQQIVVVGAANTPRCFSMTNAEGGSSVMLLGEAAAESVAADVTLEALQKRCESGTGSRESGVKDLGLENRNRNAPSRPGAQSDRNPNPRLPTPASRFPGVAP